MNILRLKNKSLVVADSPMEKVVQLSTRAARNHSPVLLCGESGTGKELIARLIHEKGEKSNGPFIAVNCAAIPEGLMEAELFGFEKGAFTGAIFQRIGKFELASGGTLLLDEISEMPFPLQAKLLRVLQEGEVDRLGSREPVKINVRLIATSNKEPEQLIAEGKFREDLYYRLNVIRINCPVLRGRREAIEVLAQYFAKECSKRHNLPEVGLAHSAIEKLVQHGWPGNIRELENVIERSFVNLEGDEVTAEEVTFERLRGQVQSNVNSKTLAEIERDTILGALDTGKERVQVAKDLGISIRTLRNKLKEYRQE